jgi:protein gp37
MAQNSSIEWTDHTFNPWWGCSKVSPACDNCYAELWAKRMGHQVWGSAADRRFFSDAHWNEPLGWNEDARVARHRKRVFCASMADVFERRSELNPQRIRLWHLIEQTPWLDWLLLTKRPQNISHMAPWGDDWPANVWLGTTVESQVFAEKRLPFLLQNGAVVRFLSCEPLLGPLDLSSWFHKKGVYPIDWVIAGGESGPRSRPMHPDWAGKLLHQCQKAKVPFHFKQWGHWAPINATAPNVPAQILSLAEERPVKMIPLGKKAAGRLLEGTTWNGFPQPSVAHA